MSALKPLKTAIIDIGSNTVRLVMYKYDKNSGLHEFGNIKTVAKLRQHILPTGEMSEEGIQSLSKTLTSFKQILDDYDVKDVKAAATAAIRQATNNAEIVARMKAETDIDIDILTEEEEAYFGFVAVANSMETSSAVTIDIGGGSTEITLFKNKKLQKTYSFPFGTVSLKQRFVKGDMIVEEERKKMHAYLIEQFKTLKWIRDVELPVIGIGGSARNIGQVHQQRIHYPISGLHQYEMERSELDDLKLHLIQLTFDELKQLDGLSSDRADTIVLAMEVFTSLMDVVKTKQFLISKKGLREGLIINRVLLDDPTAFDKYNVFEETARRFAFEYGRSEKELATLYRLASQMYEEACKLGYFDKTEADLTLITNAAKVFAIGEYIELDSSSQHTFYLLANQSIAGMTHKERVKLALLASYKNRDYFSRFTQPFISWFSREELRILRDFGALLKFVHALNVSKRNSVEKLELVHADDIVVVKVYATESAVAEVYQASKTKKHIERVFKKDVLIEFIFI